MKEIAKSNFVISDQTFDRREDVYAFNEFGKIVSRYVITDQIYSSELWSYLKDTFNIKPENVTMFCDIHSDVKNRTEKIYRYIVSVDKPYKLLFQFYDEEKIKDDEYQSEEEQKNKISDFMIHFSFESIDFVEKILEDIRKIVYYPPINKTFFIISSSTSGYELLAANIKEFDIQLDLNYGDSFVQKHNIIVEKIKNNKHGLFLFHGPSGCGKCVDGSTMVTLRNKKTNEIENISIEDFEKKLI